MGLEILEDITPNSGSFCKSQRHIGYNFPEAVCDLVDNSISAKASKIEILINPSNEELPFAIIDNGVGMSESELVNAFRLGSVSESISEHGKFGFGLKTASISQARILEVHSKVNGIFTSRKMDLNYFESTGKWNLLHAEANTVLLNSLDSLVSGTVVIWKDWDFYQSDQVNVNHLINYLGVIYNRLLKNNLEIYVNEIQVCSLPVIPPESNLLEEKKESTFEFKIYLLKHPKYWPYDFNQSNEFNSYKLFQSSHKENQGVFIYRNDRLISVVPQWYGVVANKANNFSLARIEFSYWNDDENYGLDIRHSSVRLPKNVKSVFNDYSKIIKRYAVKKMVEGDRPSGVRIRNEKLWTMISHKGGEISYEINLENEFIQEVLKNSNRRLLELLLKKIARELPIDSILARQERYFIEETLSNDDLKDLRAIYKSLYPSYTEEQINELL